MTTDERMLLLVVASMVAEADEQIAEKRNTTSNAAKEVRALIRKIRGS
jgi:hypothetical protein